MAKRGASIGAKKMVRHARKTKKRLDIKKQMLEARKTKKNAHRSKGA